MAVNFPSPLDAMPQGTLGYAEAGLRDNGPVFPLKLAGIECTALADPDDIDTVFRDKNYEPKGRLYDVVAATLGSGTLTADGPLWRERRRIISPSFRPSRVGEMVDIMGQTGSAYVTELRQQARDGVEVDVLEQMTRLTLDTLVASTIDPSMKATNGLGYETLASVFHLTTELTAGGERAKAALNAYDNVMAELDGLATELIAGARERKEDATLLSQLVYATNRTTGERLLDDKGVRDELLTTMFAGHETTALTLTWMFTLLEDRPEIVAAMRAEAQAVLGGRVPTAEDLPKFTYTGQVLKEVLRLVPAVPFVARQARNEGKFGTKIVPAGGVVVPFIYGMHRNEHDWGEDAHTFNPDNFAPARIAGRNAKAYRPFAAGPRVCAGQGFAEAEMLVHTSLFMSLLDVQMDTGQIITPKMRMTLRPDQPVRATIRPLKQAC